MGGRRWWAVWERPPGSLRPAELDRAQWAVVEANVPTTAELSPTERRRLSELSAAFVQDKHWEAARGFTIDDEVRVTVAAQACQLLLGFDEGLDWYRAVHTIVVHRSSQTQRGERSVGATALRTDTPRRLQGRTGPGWPVVLAWDAARRQGRVPAQGLNVVHHEFAHQLDLLDGTLDGTPPLDEQLRPRWVRVCTAAFEAVRAEPDEVLREYAGETPAEFFAVATEVFFSRPLELADHHPQLYDVLRVFYRQDPAQRRGSPARPVPGPSADGGERPPPDSSGSALIDR